MIHNYFTETDLNVNLENTTSPKLFKLTISSDFSRSNRKSQLHLNEGSVIEDIKTFKKGLKTKNVESIFLNFYGIDHYDDMTDIYEVPSFSLPKRHANPKVKYYQMGYIPKDWEIALSFYIKRTKTNTALLEILDKALGSLFTNKMKRKVIKEFKPLFRQEENVVSITVYFEEDV